MSQSLVNAVDSMYPSLLRTNTLVADAHFLYVACQALGPSWRLLGKSGGENGYTWPNGVRTSHDAICQVNASGQKLQQVDIIVGAGDGNPTSPSWGIIPSHEWRPSNLPVPLSDVPMPGSSVPTTPPATPPPSVTPCPDPSAHVPKPPQQYPGDHIGGQIGVALFTDYAEAGQPPDAGMAIWMFRTAWDASNGLAMADAIAKHRAVWRAVLGL